MLFGLDIDARRKVSKLVFDRVERQIIRHCSHDILYSAMSNGVMPGP